MVDYDQSFWISMDEKWVYMDEILVVVNASPAQLLKADPPPTNIETRTSQSLEVPEHAHFN